MSGRTFVGNLIGSNVAAVILITLFALVVEFSGAQFPQLVAAMQVAFALLGIADVLLLTNHVFIKSRL